MSPKTSLECSPPVSRCCHTTKKTGSNGDRTESESNKPKSKCPLRNRIYCDFIEHRSTFCVCECLRSRLQRKPKTPKCEAQPTPNDVWSFDFYAKCGKCFLSIGMPGIWHPNYVWPEWKSRKIAHSCSHRANDGKEITLAIYQHNM